jgi:hypothetical protein
MMLMALEIALAVRHVVGRFGDGQQSAVVEHQHQLDRIGRMHAGFDTDPGVGFCCGAGTHNVFYRELIVTISASAIRA